MLVPDGLYKLEYIEWNNVTIAVRQSKIRSELFLNTIVIRGYNKKNYNNDDKKTKWRLCCTYSIIEKDWARNCKSIPT